jgi:hypothetical protein
MRLFILTLFSTIIFSCNNDVYEGKWIVNKSTDTIIELDTLKLINYFELNFEVIKNRIGWSDSLYMVNSLYKIKDSLLAARPELSEGQVWDSSLVIFDKFKKARLINLECESIFDIRKSKDSYILDIILNYKTKTIDKTIYLYKNILLTSKGSIIISGYNNEDSLNIIYDESNDQLIWKEKNITLTKK